MPRPLSDSLRLSPALIAGAAILGLLVACAWAYGPGLAGPFLFDDFPNIVQNDRLTAIQDLSIESVRSAISQLEPGPVGRPVSFISFAINMAFTGLDPLFFKMTNLAIHLLNGILLFFLVRAILNGLDASQRPPRIMAIALLSVGAWLLHPLNLTSVLYVVQRMTELSAMFVFLSLLLYSYARIRQIEGKRGAALLMAGIIPVALLALFSKENGVLIVAYLVVLELCIFRFRAYAPSTGRLLQRAYLALAAMGIPVGLYVLYRFSVEYGSRDFTLVERLLTESRVLWFYVRSILLPDIRTMTLFHDDYVVSTSFFSPPSTSIAVVSLAAVIAAALWVRRKAPVFAFGVLFFFSSHLLESTVIPLELVHEHRNYVGSWSLLLVGFCYLVQLASRYHREVTVLMLAASVLVALTVSTRIRASYWRNEILLVQYHAHHHPTSVRSLQAVGSAFIAYAIEENSLPYQKKALEYYIRAYEQAPTESHALVSIIGVLYLMDDKESIARYRDVLLNNLATQPITTQTIYSFGTLARCLGGPKCHFPFWLYKDMALSLIKNPFLDVHPEYAAKVYSANANFAFLDRNFEQALAYGEKALTLYPAEPTYYLNQALVLMSAGRETEAQDYLNRARKVDGSLFMENKIASLKAQKIDQERPQAE